MKTAQWSRLQLGVRACGALLMMVPLANVAMAANTACGPSSTQTLSSFGAQSTTTGCFEVDKSFTNFNVTNQGNNGGANQITANINISGTDTFTNVTTPWAVTSTFTPTSAPIWTDSTTNTNLTATVNFLVDTSGQFINSGTNTQYPTATPGFSFAINSVSLSGLAGSTGTGGSSITLTETFCIGTGACTAANTITLSAVIGNNSTVAGTFACSVGAGVTAAIGTCGAGATFNFAIPVTTVNVFDQYNLNNHNGTDFLTSFSNTFGEIEVTPEPSTLVLLGTALVGVGFARFRKNRI